MDAALSADQELLVSTAAAMAFDRADWAALVDSGFVAMHIPEALGGGGAHSSDTALVVEQFGRALSATPLLGQGVLGPELLRLCDAPAEFFDSIARGESRISVALGPDLLGLAVTDASGLVFDATDATDALLLSPDRHVVRVALEPLTGPVATGPQTDRTRLLRPLTPEAARGGGTVGSPLSGEALIRFEAFALVMIAADLLGVMQGALDDAVAHVSQREQFGAPVGTFQAVQHLAAEAKVLVEATRASLWFAAWALDELEADAALLAARQLKAEASMAALEVVEIQTQLLGGIAITDEHEAHCRVRRVLVDRLVLGDEHLQFDRIAESRLGAVL